MDKELEIKPLATLTRGDSSTRATIGTPTHNIRDILSLARAVLQPSLDAHGCFGMTREDFVRLNPEELAKIYDSELENQRLLLSLINDIERFLPSVHALRRAPSSPLLFKKEAEEDVLTAEQKNHLEALRQQNELKIYLIAEDTFSHLKIFISKLMRTLKPFLSVSTACVASNHRAVSSTEWEEKKLTIDRVDDYVIICAANGKVALEIYQYLHTSIVSIITDQEMPLMMGSELLSTIRSFESSAGSHRTIMTMCTSLSNEMLLPIAPLLASLDVVCLTKGPGISDEAILRALNLSMDRAFVLPMILG